MTKEAVANLAGAAVTPDMVDVEISQGEGCGRRLQRRLQSGVKAWKHRQVTLNRLETQRMARSIVDRCC